MAIFITGDTHGDFSRLQPAAFHEQRNLTKDDCLIICGDFGGVWNGSDTEQRWLDWLEDRPFTTLFVSGNHENFDLLRSYPISQWHGGLVQAIRPSVLHLMRASFMTSAESGFSPWVGPVAMTSGKVFWSRMIRTMSESCGSSTPQARCSVSTTGRGGKRNCPARMNTEPQEQRWTR